MKAAALKLDKILVRREFWENRSLWLVPLVVAGILTVLSIYMLVAVLIGHNQTVNNVDFDNGAHFQLDNMPDFSDADPDAVSMFVRVVTLGLGAMFSGLMQIVVFFYLLDSLYAERRDRSVLFWRSMPVSDLRSVLSKLGTALISVTAVTFVITIAFQLVLLVLFMIMGTSVGTHPWALLAHPGAFLGAWLLLAYGLVVQAIWYLPFYGWTMLASSWAKKVPFLWAILVPVGVMFAEAWVFHTGHFARMLVAYKLRWLELAFNINPVDMHSLKHMDIGQGPMVGLDNVGAILSSPSLWIGLAVAAAFVYGAIWLRGKRSEI
jgi:ABC-2 type transport system permease protein